MRLRLALLAALVPLLCAAPAGARYRVGIGEQDAAMFASPAWQGLRLRLVRYIVPWDWYEAGQQAEVSAFMRAARANGQDVLVTFTSRRGCYDGLRYSRDAACRAPSASAYRAAFRLFDDAYPWVRTYSAWNEVNHVSQPTFGQPRLAVRYYDVLRRESRRRRFRVMAADVLDTANMAPYLRSFLRLAPGRPRLWGLHNYQDVNRHTSLDTHDMLATVPGEVWLTETGAIVRLGDSPQWGYSEARAADRTRWMFTLARRTRIARLFVYKWFGAPAGARFDAGLVNADGGARPALAVLRGIAAAHR